MCSDPHANRRGAPDFQHAGISLGSEFHRFGKTCKDQQRTPPHNVTGRICHLELLSPERRIWKSTGPEVKDLQVHAALTRGDVAHRGRVLQQLIQRGVSEPKLERSVS